MKIIKVQDKYNDNKVWVIKKTDCNHYYWNQEINGRLYYKSFCRTTLKYINSVLGS